MIDRYDCICNDEAVCPYCGESVKDSEECFGVYEESTHINCDGCGQDFYATKVVDVSYTTAPVGGWPKTERKPEQPAGGG